MNKAAIDSDDESLRAELVDYFNGSGQLAVVKAPPGSGKTYTLVKLLALLVESGLNVAVAAQTNSQANDICKRFANEQPGIVVARFASSSSEPPSDLPGSVRWISHSRDLPVGPGVAVGTTAKWSLTNLDQPYDLLAIDESWQMGWADMMQLATISGRFFLIGDPGQIPPTVTIDVRRWETSPRAPHRAAPEVVLADDALSETRFDGSLSACRRLPAEAVDFVKPFYDFDFVAYADKSEQALLLPDGHPWRPAISNGLPLVLTVPTPDHGPPVEVDHDLALAVADVVENLLTADATVKLGAELRAIEPFDIGITSTHRVMNSAIASALGNRAGQISVDTPERWQGLETPVMIAVHPLSGVTDPSAFDLETGRLCVMASRHQAALIVLARDHVGATLRYYVPAAAQAPGKPDVVGRGHNAHLTFWEQLETAGTVLPLS